ncbi:MAG: CCA tRNA nucleotidyltransferase [Alphaproteobacteria bacterium PA3]|nr:MAG: CCA tRNA nucleotidyltransferase [Alphaproteobacteria bacterium PA3]
MTEISLASHALVRNSDAQAVLTALNAAQADCSRLVGGCVRDAVLGKLAHDIDIATQLAPEDVIAALQAAGIKVVPTGLAHGTVTAIPAGKPVEVTTLRTDVATDGRYAEVVFTDDWLADAQRRDLTMNALYCDALGHVFDPVGTGVADAKAGRVRFVGDSETRVTEDYLRILRFFRFHAFYGKGAPDPVALAACAAHRDGMAKLSVERVWMELKRLLAAPDPRVVLSAMAKTGVLAAILPEAEGLDALQHLVEIENSLFLDPEALQRLMALLPRDPTRVAGLVSRLKLSSAEGDRLLAWASDQTGIASYLSAREVRRALYWMGTPLYLDRVRLAWAHDSEPRRTSQWRAMIALSSGFVAPRFPVTGEQVLAAGARPGPAIGHILRELERWWVENDFTEDEMGLVERLKALVQALG